MGNGGTAHGSDESYESNNSDDSNGERPTPLYLVGRSSCSDSVQ